MTDKQIIFTSRKIPNNSFTMRGEQMAWALRSLGYNAVTMPPKEATEAQSAVVVWVRRLWTNKAAKCKQNNIAIYDPLDRIEDLPRKWARKNFHAVILPSKSQYREVCENPLYADLKKFFLLHHWDPALQQYKYDRFTLGYWGYTTSAVNVRNFIDKNYRFTAARSGEYPPETWFQRVSCHYSIRDKQRGFGWRPTTKISTAAACGANIICSRDAMSEEVLPADYPFFVNGYGYDDTEEMIEHARYSYGREPWKYGLECMSKARKRTSLIRCAKLYGKIIETLCEELK